MGANQIAAEIEFLRREVPVFAGKIVIKREPQPGDIARGGTLRRVGQTRGILVPAMLHPELARLPRHIPGKIRLAAGKILGNHRGRVIGRSGDEPEDQVPSGIVSPGVSPSLLGERLAASADTERADRADASLVERLKVKYSVIILVSDAG